MILNPLQLEKLSEKIGQDVTTPAGATILQLDIESVTGARLGLNTVKRLVGVLSDDDMMPRPTTLNTLARYLGYPDWTSVEEDTLMKGSGFGAGNPFVDMAAFECGAMVEICWKPDRKIVLRHDGNGRYIVVGSENSKLRPGDAVLLSQLAVGFPFVADDVVRNQQQLGCYRAADGAGITRFDILEGDARRQDC